MAKKSASTSDNGQVCAILSYLLIGIIWYFVDEQMKKNSLAKYHVKQAIVLIIFAIGWGIFISILSIFLFFLGPLFFLVTLLGYVPLILALFGIVNALNKKEAPLPIIGQYASKLTF